MKLPLIALLTFLVAAPILACGGGEAPTLSNLQITTSPVVRGAQANGTIDVSDPDGLAGLTITLKFSGPAELSLPVTPVGLTETQTQATLALAFLLSAGSPTGAYTLEATATDADDLVSNAVTTTFTAE